MTTRQPADDSPRAPAHLPPTAKRLWTRLVSDFGIDDAGGLELVLTACLAHARAQDAREAIAKDGAVTRDRFGQLRAHPAVAIERDSLSLLVRALRALNLELDDDDLSPRERRTVAAARAATGKFAPGKPPSVALVKGAAK
jgi:P27 family predicted phage terminase small subunit